MFALTAKRNGGSPIAIAAPRSPVVEVLKTDGKTPLLFTSVHKACEMNELFTAQVKASVTNHNIVFRNSANELYGNMRKLSSKEDAEMDRMVVAANIGMDITKMAIFYFGKELKYNFYSEEMDKLIRQIICK